MGSKTKLARSNHAHGDPSLAAAHDPLPVFYIIEVRQGEISLRLGPAAKREYVVPGIPLMRPVCDIVAKIYLTGEERKDG